jgi:hypothetical protein
MAVGAALISFSMTLELNTGVLTGTLGILVFLAACAASNANKR